MANDAGPAGARWRTGGDADFEGKKPAAKNAAASIDWLLPARRGNARGDGLEGELTRRGRTSLIWYGVYADISSGACCQVRTQIG